MKKIILDFGSLKLEATLSDSSVADNFYANLPFTIPLQKWGGELYGPTGMDLGEENPVPTIPPGGLAYTNNGNYFCIFFGQTPAWSVEHIGEIDGVGWEKLIENSSYDKVTIYAKN